MALVRLFEENYLQKVLLSHQYTTFHALIADSISHVYPNERGSKERQRVLAVLRAHGLKDAVTDLFGLERVDLKYVNLVERKAELFSSALRFKTPAEFKEGAVLDYNQLVKHGWLGELSEAMGTTSVINIEFLESRLKSGKYKTWEAFIKAHQGVDDYVRSAGLKVEALCEKYKLQLPKNRWTPQSVEEAVGFIKERGYTSMADFKDRQGRMYTQLRTKGLITKISYAMSWDVSPPVSVEDVIITLCKASGITHFSELKRQHPDLGIWAETSHKKRFIEEAISPKARETVKSENEIKLKIIDDIKKANILSNRQFKDSFPDHYSVLIEMRSLPEVYEATGLRREGYIPSEELLERASVFKSKEELWLKAPHVWGLIRKRQIERLLPYS
ncbi:MAG: hypothetical protein EOP06_04190 [Proteobacteria bacterium]|nr:MAG: hypothetical protein EOP06_04190 [Pseudomonadota bacterium]